MIYLTSFLRPWLPLRNLVGWWSLRIFPALTFNNTDITLPVWWIWPQKLKLSGWRWCHVSAAGTDLSPEVSLPTPVPGLCHPAGFWGSRACAEVRSQLASAGIYKRHLKVTSILLLGNQGGKVQQRMWIWVESNELGQEAGRLQVQGSWVGRAFLSRSCCSSGYGWCPEGVGRIYSAVRKEHVWRLIAFIPTSVGIFRSWGLCPLKSVIEEENVGGKCKEKIPLGHSLESLYPCPKGQVHHMVRKVH